MESISERERTLLGCVPRDPFTGVADSRHGDSRRGDSDVDFNDVFGGPPRRSSLYELRQSRADSIDSCRRGRDALVKSRPSRLGLGEKPVFGDGDRPGRRRQLGNDFFSDIFQCSESGCSSQSRGDRDPFLSSAPGSRVLSPIRPASLNHESLLAESALKAHDRLSVKLLKVLNPPASSSPSHRSVYNSEDGGSDMCSFPSSPNALSTGFTTQSMVGHGELRNNAHVSYRQSPLPRQIACSFESLSETTDPACQATVNQIGKSSSSLEAYVSNGQFHFSIYKWAGKGVTLIMPSNSTETNAYEGKLKKIPEIIVQEFEVPSNCDYFSPVAKVSETKTVIQEGMSANDNVVGRNEDGYITIAENLSLSESDPKILQDDQNETSENFGDQIEKVSIPGTDKISNTSNAHGKQNPDFKSNSRGEQNPELKSLSQLIIDDDINRQRSDDIPRQAKEGDVLSKDQKKQQLRRKSRVDYGEARSATMIDTPAFSEYRTRGHKVKGKVIEFIKKFNQEVLPKQKGTSKMLDRKSRDKGNREDKVNKLAQASNEEDKLQRKSWNSNLPLFDIPNIMENKIMKNAAEEKFSITCDGHMINDLPSEEKNETMHPSSETTPEALDIAAWDEEIDHEEIEGFLQLSSKETEGVQNSSQQDQIKRLDSKVQEWSKGKEGNIRSLLSTLQYVLWPESGWKQVPLVGIIEGPSVKKAYQRALLCLHPDKLQQKGVSSNQKYIAEKVFGILQEAWDQFNTISQF